ncbi:MAG TPA: hypothetical protein VF721_04345 [Pyrinomonadaceae bacterium]|jgi:hypothetical protein
MKLKTKAISLCLLVFFSCCVAQAQEKNDLPTSAEDENECVLKVSSSMVIVSFSVWSGKKGYLKNLTAKDFEVYDREEEQEIDSVVFDELNNRYFIEFYEKDAPSSFEKQDVKIHDVKIKVKLSKQSRRDYGEITVMLQ